MKEELHIDYSGNIIDMLKQINVLLHTTSKSADDFQKSAAKSLDETNKKLNAQRWAALHQNVVNVGEALSDLSQPGLDFNSNLQDLSALTGTTGAALDLLGEKARASAKEFGGNASNSLNTYKTILSRLGPGIAENQEALQLMERDVQILSKTMGGDAPGAVDALTTAVLQFGVDLSDPASAAQEMTRMMDIMANSAQQGAAEVPQVSAALKVAGVAAQQSKVTFIEANAAIQALAAGGKEGAEAGTALRNVLGKLAGEEILTEDVVNKLRHLGVDMQIVSDTSLPFTTRLRELSKAQGDAVVMTKMFGVENAAAAQILLNSVDAQDELAAVIGRAGGAQEQANIVMESAAEKLARMQARIDDAKIAFFEMTGGLTAYLGPATEVARTISAFTPLYTGAKNAVLLLATAQGRATIAEKASTAAKLIGGAATKTVTAATWLWNAALTANPIGLVIAAAAALATGIYALSRAFDTSTAAQRVNAEITREVNAAMVDEQVQLELLFGQLKKTNPGTEERKKLIDELGQKYPDLLDKYDLEKASLADIDRLQKEATKSARQRIELQLKQEKATELLREAQKIEDTHWFWNNNWSESGKMEEVNELRAAADELLNEVEKTKLQSLKSKGISPEEKLKKAQQAGYESWDDYKNSGWKWLGAGEDPGPGLGTTSGYSPTTDSATSSTSSGGSGTIKNITVHIQNLMSGDIVINSATIKEGTAEIRKKVTETLVGALRDFEVSG